MLYGRYWKQTKIELKESLCMTQFIEKTWKLWNLKIRNLLTNGKIYSWKAKAKMAHFENQNTYMS